MINIKTQNSCSNSWQIKGVLLDMARQTESFDYYARLIPSLAEWGYNTVIAHMFDDEGCAIKLDSPSTLPTPNAFSVEEWIELVKIATIHNIEIIPEIECLGHTGFLTRLPIYSELREPPSQDGHYWSICPLREQTLELIGELIAALSEIFPSRFIHIGMDEADIGGSDLCRETLKLTPLWKMFGNHVLKIIDICEKRGLRCLMWGDHLHKEKDLRNMLVGHDIIICDWLYGKGHQENYRDSIMQLIDDGFEVIGCPSGCWSGTFMIPHADNINNINNFEKECRDLNHPMIKGMLNTMWASFRHLPAIVHPVIAYAGYVFSGGDNKLEDFLPCFATKTFGIPQGKANIIASSIASLHQRRFRDMLDKLIMSQESISHHMKEINILIDIYGNAVNKLVSVESLVTLHHDEYDQWLFTAQFMWDLTKVRANELNGQNSIDWLYLYECFQSACLKRRSYTGRENDEVKMGQVPLYWQNSDNPAELLAILAKKRELQMNQNMENFKDSVLKFVNNCQDKNKSYHYYFSKSVEHPTLYASTYAVMLKSLFNDLPSDSECDEWAYFINSFQGEDGLFKDPVIWNDGWYKNDPEWCGRRHLTCHAIIALTCLGHTAKKSFDFLNSFLNIDFLISWLEKRDWQTQRISFAGNEVMNIGTLLQYARDFHNDKKAGKASDALLDWLSQNHINPNTGLWGKLNMEDPNERSQAVMAAYHFWPLFTYDKRPIPYIEKAIDSVLSSQNPIGGFGWGCHNNKNPYDSSACEDIDSIEPLCRFSQMSDHKKEKIMVALKKAEVWVLSNQINDGGFVFTKNNPFFYGNKQSSSPENTGAMFPTWFRTLSLTYIGKVLNGSKLYSYPWHFVKCPGYQFWE